MKILKLTPQQSQELIALNNQSGKHLNPCDYGAGISVQADFDEATYSAHKAYLDAEGITPTNILVTDEEKLVVTKLDATQHYLKKHCGIVNNRIRDNFPSPI